MRRLALPLALVLAVLVAGAAGAANATAFTGEWIGNDPVPPNGDGSVVHLYVTGGTQAKITYTDEYGSVCISGGSPVTSFTSTATGTVYGDLLAATFRSARCGPVPLLLLRGENIILELDDQGNDDPADDTLWDGSVTWQRAD